MSGITVSWTRAVNSDGDSESGAESVPLDARQLWAQLLQKAENPVPYTPAITRCTILDRFPGGFTREIVRDGRPVFQRIEIDPGQRIVYRQPGDPEVEFITNEVGCDEDGRLALTISVRLAPAATAKAFRESRFLEAADAYFTDALHSAVDEIRATAGHFTILSAVA
ncbi:AtaL-like protein [Kitasatospora sp. MAP5-34]|uniref:AtaL-like protein n=1 Tax=Kitasatospora sp. MAP5-34 TaxID=3035102 RepID=UPI0024739380|nr:AtaL-like protein [Kitasatospora sp. MAP5-34]MDH6576295.1 hypothetical protein [Kitasatospora sp. MAP5-34]